MIILGIMMIIIMIWVQILHEDNKEIQVEVSEISDDPLEINSEEDFKQVLIFVNLEINQIDIGELYTPEEALEIEFENYLSEPIRDDILSKTPIHLLKFLFDDFIEIIISYIEKYAEKMIYTNIYFWICSFHFIIFIQLMNYRNIIH